MSFPQFASGTVRLRSNSFALFIGFLMAFCLCGRAQVAPAGHEVADLSVAGIAGPSRVLLSTRRPSVTKPVTVILENRGTEVRTIPDAESLRRLVELKVQPLATIPSPRLVLVPPKKFPITLRPKQKLAVVFQVGFELGGAPPGTIAVCYEAASPFTPDAVPATEAAAATFPAAQAFAVPGVLARPDTRSAAGASLGPDKGASIIATPLRVPLKKGATMSEPITCTAKWDRPYYVSGWEGMPADPVADPIFDAAANARTVKPKWKNPGTYTVGVYLIHFISPGNFEQAHPTIEVHVIKVELKDDSGDDADGMKIGVTTKTDRSRSLKAIVTPASETSNVMIKVTKGSALAVKDINYGNGEITFKAEGTGTTGSKTQGDQTIEAQVEGKTAASAKITVVVPRFLEKQEIVQKDDRNFLAYQSDGKHPGSSPNITGSPVYPMARMATFYGFLVKIPVSDQFHQAIDGPHLYAGADVVESIGAIHRTIQAGSFYLDPAGFLGVDWNPGRAPVNVNSAVAQNFVNAPPLFPYPPKLRNLPFFGNAELDVPAFTVTVDGFPCTPPIKRKLIVESNGNIKLEQTP